MDEVSSNYFSLRKKKSACCLVDFILFGVGLFSTSSLFSWKEWISRYVAFTIYVWLCFSNLLYD